MLERCNRCCIVEGPVRNITSTEIVKSKKEINVGKPYDAYIEMIITSDNILIYVKLEFCQRVLKGEKYPTSGKLAWWYQFLMKKWIWVNCGSYQSVVGTSTRKPLLLSRYSSV